MHVFYVLFAFIVFAGLWYIQGGGTASESQPESKHGKNNKNVQNQRKPEKTEKTNKSRIKLCRNCLEDLFIVFALPIFKKIQYMPY